MSTNNLKGVFQEFAEYLNESDYTAIAGLISDDCILSYSRIHTRVQGREAIKALLERALSHDMSGRWPIKLVACVAETRYDKDEIERNSLAG